MAPGTSSPLASLISFLLILTVLSIFLSRITTVSVPEIMPAVAETGVVAVTLPSVPTVNPITVCCNSYPAGSVVSVRVYLPALRPVITVCSDPDVKVTLEVVLVAEDVTSVEPCFRVTPERSTLLPPPT